jgi:hypothetical protein
MPAVTVEIEDGSGAVRRVEGMCSKKGNRNEDFQDYYSQIWLEKRTNRHSSVPIHMKQ